MVGQVMSKPSNVVYRHGERAEYTKWYARKVGWFGSFCVLVMVGGLFGVSLTMRSSLLNTVNTQFSQTLPHVEEPEIASTAVLNPTLANNIVDLQPVLNDWAKTHKGQRWSVVVKSLDGPEFEAQLNEESVYESASLYKLFLTLPLNQQIPMERQKQVRIDAGGTKRTIAQCVDLMIRLSDNPCGEALGYYLNWGKADKSLKEAGFTRTDFIHHTDELQTSAKDIASFLQQLNGTMFPAATRDSIMTSMSKQVFRQGIPAGCPGCQVYDKIGNIDNVLHDAGIVQYSRGKYVLVIMSENSRSYKEIAKLTGQIQQAILDGIK